MGPRNPYLCVIILVALSVVAVLGLVGVFVLAALKIPSPGEAIALAGNAVGALSSFLVQIPRGSVGGPAANAQAPPAAH